MKRLAGILALLALSSTAHADRPPADAKDCIVTTEIIELPDGTAAIRTQWRCERKLESKKRSDHTWQKKD